MAERGVRRHKAKSSTEPWDRRSGGDTTGAGNREGAADRGRSAGKARGNATWTGVHRNRSHAAPGRAEIDRRQRRGHDSTHGRMRLSNLAADLAATEGADVRRCASFGHTGRSAAKTSASSSRAASLKSDHEVAIGYDSIMSDATPEVTQVLSDSPAGGVGRDDSGRLRGVVGLSARPALAWPSPALHLSMMVYTPRVCINHRASGLYRNRSGGSS